MVKITQNDKVIDVVRFPRYITFLPTGHVAITDKGSAQGIVGSDTISIYSFTPVAHKTAGVVAIAEIEQEEYDRLRKLLDAGETVCADESVLAEAKRIALKRLSNICKSKITAGFNIKLSDGETYNFKLTTEDQLNLMIIENQLNSGAETFIYHATDQPCAFFSKDDMIKIINTFKRYTLYHTTYFNVAKQYIKSLLDLEKVNTFAYGTDVSDTVEDKVIRQILKVGGNIE